MSKRINHHIAKFVYYIVAAIVLFFSFMMFARVLAGCTTPKKALNKVLTDPELLQVAGERYLKLNPPIKDTTTIHDTTTVSETETVLQTDTVSTKDTVYITQIKERVVTKTRTKTETVADLSVANRLNDSLNKYRIELAGKNGQILESRNTITEQAKTIRTQKILLYVLGFVIAVLLFLFLKDKVRLPKLSNIFK